MTPKDKPTIKSDNLPFFLSSFQHREWVLWRMADGRSDRAVAAAHKLAGPLEENGVKGRLQKALRRHPVLCLAFDAEDSFGTFTPIADLPLAVRYARPEENLAAAAARVAREIAAEPFLLTELPAVRAALVHAGFEGKRQSALLLVAHPIIADERSLEILLEEIDSPEVPEKVDESFFGWTSQFASPELQEANNGMLAFYRQILTDACFQLDLPTDRARPPVFDSAGDFLEIGIPPRVREAAERFAAAESTTFTTVVLAALAAYLGRISRQAEVVLGLSADLRPAGGEAWIGPFENTAVLRVRLEEGITGQGLIRQVRESLAALDTLRDLPFETLVEALQPERDPSRSPIFQVHFAQRMRLTDQGRLPAPTGRVGSDLEVVLEQTDHECGLRLNYRKDIFQRDSIQHMGGQLIELMRALCDWTTEAVQSLSVCTPPERAWILDALGAQQSFSADATIHGLVAAAAARSPESAAVSFGGVKLSYRELNLRANRLAHRLRRLGVGRDVGVGVCMERSEELIIALLAILKAGGAYVPIEPANPKERIEFVLSDSKARLVLTEPALRDKVAGAAVETLVLEPGGAAFADESASDPGEVSGPDGLAYVIYTSGSTGRPKGVLIEHRNVVRLFQATQHWFKFDERDVWTMFHSVAFDFSVWEIWGALIYGGRVVVVPYLASRSPAEFYDLVAAEQVTVLNQTPSAFRQFIQAEAENGRRDLALRLVIFGGEALEFESLRPWFERHGDQSPRLVNMYGITETCVHVTYRQVAMADLESGMGASIIGVPIPDLSAYVVDEKLQLLPPGIPGELVVGGAGLARGYHERPELTAERFVDDPFSKKAGGRLYRSGDLVRLLPTGELDYLGRIDFQVKIRGFRIETGEIEAVLRRSGLVQDVAVIPRQSNRQETLLTAYVVSDRPVMELRRAARLSLPEYMVPAHFVVVPSIPMTINGKVDRKALPDPQPGGEVGASEFLQPAGELEQIIAETWCEVLGAEKVSTNERFFDIGGTSLGVVRVVTKLKQRLKRDIGVVTLFQHPTVSALAKHLAQTGQRTGPIETLSLGSRPSCKEDEPIAIVGMAGRFPGAGGVEALWELLAAGREAITFFEEKDLDPSLDPTMVVDPAYVKARGILEGADLFDAAFFGMSPREAEITDPQQRVLMEVAWEALEHAGVDPSSFPGLIATYAGVYNNTYYLENVLKRSDVMANVGAFQAMAGNEKDFVATRIAHRLDLKGPAVSIHTACSTSLVAVAQAFYALRTGQCDLALAGAAAVTCPQRSGYLYQEGGMLSSDGHTRPFDAQASGTVFSDGAAMVVLRRLSDALAAGDTVYAVIRGAATNNDGGQRMSFSAPTVEGQAAVIAKALSVAGVHPETIGYVEAHGTATPLGDPIEVEGLKKAFGVNNSKHGFCALGSIKSNLGHLTAPAGAAGLIKTVLSLERQLIPPSLGFSRANPEISFEKSPFFVAAKSLPWPRRNGEPRRAGVSSFGVGGTNAHVVVEEAPLPETSGPSRAQQLLVLSAKTESAAQRMAGNFAAHLEAHPGVNLADVAFTLQNGRQAFSHRRAAVASNTPEAVARLRSAEKREVFTGTARAQAPAVVFLFPGQGAQHLNMGRELYEGEAVFREEVDRCTEALRRHIELDLRTVLYPEAAEASAQDYRINQTWLAQPAIFVIEYALARLWMSWGVKPAVLIGHSIGEYVAAVLAETFTLENALALLSARARLMQALPAGSMVAVRRGAGEIESMLPAGCSIAAINSPVLCAVSGPTEIIQKWQKEIESQGIAVRALFTSHAFHSAMMEPMLPEFAAVARQVPSRPPKLPWVSTCTGGWMNREQPVEADYWVRQVRQTVRFADALEAVIADPGNFLLEVGPGQTLSQLARQHAKKPKDSLVIASLGPVGEPGRDLHSVLSALGRLWVSGVDVDWAEFSAAEKRRRVPLPSYPFERKRYWIEPAKTQAPSLPENPVPVFSQSVEIMQSKEPEMQTAPVALDVTSPNRKDRIIRELRELFQSYSGTDFSQADEKESFMDLGFDSLLLTQASQGVGKRFRVKVTFRQMLGDLGTLDSLAEFLDKKLPPDPKPQPAVQPSPAGTSQPRSQSAGKAAPAAAAVAPSLPPMPSAGSGGLVETVIQQQMALMAQQLELLRQGGAAAGGPPAPAAGPSAAAMPVVTALNLEKQSHFGPFKAIEKGPAGGLTERQQAALDKLVARYNRRTAKSKALAQQHRAYFCDPRAAGNFRQLWKEMVYPIACARSKGSRIWDIDGNEYIDVTMGFGANYLGHSPDFVMKAIEEQMKRGVEIGPQSPIAGEVAQMICEFTGMDRVTFCNTGSEAVMAAFRVARTVTGREKIVYFYGDYHGIFDEVLGRPALFDGAPGAMPIAPGIPHLANVMILEYGNTSSLDAIRRHAEEIAAVIVEPVQSRHPDLQPREFLHELRDITREQEIALIFDEVITGFRVAPGGAQEFFGVKADMATYGKVVGGGMPIGVLAGSATYMDALDGGFWQYGDDSSPPTGVTFFAGTFVRHPLAMAAAHAVLNYLKTAGPGLQAQTNQRTARFVERVNGFLQGRQLPMQLQKFSALFYYDFHSDLKFAGLLFYYLRDRGIHIWEGRVGTLSIAHTDQDMDRVLQAFQESVQEMQSGGFLPEPARSTSSTPASLADLIGGGVSGTGQASGIAASDPCRFALSEAQREMWIGAQMRPEAAGPHHACTGLYLDGPLDVERLRRAIQTVVQRHEGLRCTFSEDGSEAILHSELVPEVPLHDLSGLQESQREERVNEILHQEGRRLLDLAKGPLVDFQILKLSPQLHMLILTAQMIVCDGWSHYVVFEDLGAIYSALVGGTEPPLKPPIPMSEYARWQQANAGTEEARECEAYWRSQFKTVPQPIDLPTSRPRPPARTFEGDRRELILPPQLFQDIKRLAKEQKNSYFAVLLAAFQAWLHRLSGACDLVVGVPFAAQGPLDMDRLVGQCANILPLRAQLDPTAAFSSLLRSTWASVLDAQEHWDFSYGRLISQLELPRDPSRIPLVSVLFNIDPPMAKVKFSGLKHRFITGPRYYFQYDLGFNLVEEEGTIKVECDYNRNMFDGDVVQCWVAGYQALLESIVRDPAQPAGRLPMVSEGDLGRLVAEKVSETPADAPAAAIQALVKARVEHTPDAIAATCEGRSLTYRELDRLSNRLANRLQALGAGPDTVVGVRLDRSLDLPVALLGSLKAGAAYVNLGEAFSDEQLAHLIVDSGVKVILADHRAAADLPATSARVLPIDQDASADVPASDTPPLVSVDPERLACIVYKPSLNGQPQGVEITHRAAVNGLIAMQREPGLSEEDVVLWHGSALFDLELFELWLPLASGARTVIAPRATVREPQELRRIIEEQGITAMQATSSAWRMLLASGWAGGKRFKALCRGEALPPDLAERLAGLCGEAWNAYGAAETTFAAMIGRVQAGAPVTLGHPVCSTQVALVDAQFERVPAGVPGEILIAGSCLARGYRNLADLTAERFMNRSIGGSSACRFFRSGDMARYRPDGGIEFVGRRDRQLKIRSFHVDPGEVEAVLRGHPAVQDAVVSLRADMGNEPGLAAYILPGNKEEKAPPLPATELIKEMSRLLRSRLPEYMLPSRFVLLGDLPRKADGRVDHAALPAPTDADIAFEDYVAPRDKTEEILARIWQELLNLPKVNVRDSFFDLGGKSLLAVRLFVRIEQEFGRKLPLATLFRAPSIEQLARLLTAGDDSPSKWPSLVPIQPKGHKPPLFLVHGAGGNVLLYQALAKQLEPDYPLYGLQSQGLDGQSTPLRTIEEMADRYLQEIREVQPSGPYLLGGYCLGGTVAYEMAQRLVAGGEKVSIVAMLDTYNFSRALRVSFYSFLLQKFRFHLSNFISLRPGTMWRYLREKKRIAADGGWAHIRTEMPGSTLQDGVARAESGAEASVQEINDHAGDIYEPKPYPGMLTLFKPHINYKFYPDPKMGWEDLALGGLDIVEMPINPHAMLVEPYVETLAGELKTRLSRQAGGLTSLAA